MPIGVSLSFFSFYLVQHSNDVGQSMYTYRYIYIYIIVCVYIYIYMYIYIYVYIYEDVG